ncbi:hypothetical protein [Pyxidicoccus xibeiensis]|uniref:hypothetical protein n=1 Tax=Pyxidicoccus xibeiensis TaxID=2906759 RepID=UPI0020A738A0|nr:hypothetical protein [Pyxidicoccus xibeiensis]MCP3144002.1 hypothetical protein [Pyxidicoccus xibeiensis]
MKMNHFVIPALMMLGLTTACVESTPILQLKGGAPQNDDCSFPNTAEVSQLRGSVNLGFVGGYPLVFGVTSNVITTAIEVSEEPVLGDPDLNTIYITDLVLSYRTNPEFENFPQPRGPVPLHGTIEQDGQLLLNLLTAEAVDFLDDRAGAGGIEVLVTMHLRGKRASGDEVESNEITYPITVTNVPYLDVQAALCPGQVFEPRTDSCDQRGLNGSYPACEDPPAP